MSGVPLVDIVSMILPSDIATGLLQSCLWKGQEAQKAWDGWQRSVGSAADFLKSDRSGLKRLLPLLQYNLQTEGATLTPAVGSILRAARAREELRYASFRRFGGEGIESILKANVATIVLKGAAFAALYYPDPSLRHCHDIDLLVRTEDRDRIIAAAVDVGFSFGNVDNASGGIRLTHASGLPIECHFSPFRVLHYPVDSRGLWEHAQSCEILGLACRTLAPTDMLAHLCGHALWNPRRHSMCWVADAYLLLASGDFSWRPFLDTIHAWQIDLPVFVILQYLSGVLRSPIPDRVLGELRDYAVRTDGPRKRAALEAIHSSGNTGRSKMFRCAGWSSRLAILRWTFLQRLGFEFRGRAFQPGTD